MKETRSCPKGSVTQGAPGARIAVLPAKQEGCARKAVGVWGMRKERSHPSGYNRSGSDLASLDGGPWGLNNPESLSFSSPFHRCVTTSKSLHLSELLCPHLERDKQIVCPLSGGNMFQDRQWVPETMGSAEPYRYCFLSFL